MNSLLSILSSIRWQDAVDIALNSYILFRLYIFFRDTRVLRILLGLGLLWFLQRLSVSQGMIITNYVLQGLIAVAAFIIIIVFRNEIFSILQAGNLKTFFWGTPPHNIKTSEESIIESLMELARNRLGALIIFPGKDSLEEVVQSGIPWHGSISKEMILTIFWPNNPVHDGAAVIKGNKVTHVGGILPLSQRKDLPSYYGTRHRAAAGLAESTDALVFLVSEERGTIIAAKGNNMTPLYSEEEIRGALQEHLGIAVEKDRTSYQKKRETVIAGFLSFFIIAGMWLSFTRGQNALMALDVPIQFINQRQDVQITDWSTDSVRVQLSGAASLIRNMKTEDIHIEIDIENTPTGEKTFQITKNNIKLPPGIAIKNIHPENVSANLDVRITKELPVQVDWTGGLPGDLIIQNVTVEPERLKVNGWGQIMENKSTIYTERIPLETIRKSGIISVRPFFEDPGMTLTPDSPEKIRIKVTVGKRAS